MNRMNQGTEVRDDRCWFNGRSKPCKFKIGEREEDGGRTWSYYLALSTRSQILFPGFVDFTATCAKNWR